MRTSRLKRIVSGCVLVALLVAAYVVVDFACELKGNKSHIVWSNFEQSEDLDTIYIGTSIAASSFNPNLIDELSGWNSANMASPLQKIEETFLGIQTAYERFHVQRVVMTLDFTELQLNETPNLGSAYLTQRGRVVGLQEYLASTAWLIAEKGAASVPGSLNVIFPWVSNHPAWKDGLTGIERNVTSKLDGSSVAEAVEAMEPGWIYFGKGYGNKYAVIDYDSSDLALFGEIERIETLDFDEGAIEAVAQICDYCKERGIDLVVVNVPIPVFNIHGYGQFYVDSQDRVGRLLDEMGVAYYDFAYARPQLLELSPQDFYDNQHLNAIGADRFSAAFVRFMEMRERGEDVSDLFYSPQEYLSLLDYVSGVKLSATSREDGIEAVAQAYAGADATPEFQFLVQAQGSDEWVCVRDYGDSGTIVYKPDTKGVYSVRVNARVKGSDSEYDHFNVIEVIF